MLRLFSRSLPLLLLGLLLLCAPAAAEEAAPTPGPEPAAISEAQQLLDRGIGLYRDGALDDALSLFRGFVVSHYDTPLVNRANLYLARIFLDRGNYPDAQLYLDRIPVEMWGPEENFIKGVALIETGFPEQGADLLLPLQNGPLFAEDRARLLVSLAEANAQLGRPLRSIMMLHQSLDQGGERENILVRSHRLFKEQMSDAELEETSFMFKGTPFAQDATIQLAWRAMLRGEASEASNLVTAVMADPTPFPYRKDAALLLDRLSGGRWLQRNAIGVLLPLSGRYAPFGQLVKRGVELAAEVSQPQQQSVRFVFRDTGGDPETTRAAVSELANQERVMAILGPLIPAAAEAAAEKAQEEGVPLLTLSPKEGLPETGNFVFRNSLTSRLQARTLARYAVQERGISAFGILAPETRQGTEMALLFTQEVKKLGGLVVDVEQYPGSATDFRRQILLLRGEDPDAPEEEPAPPLTEIEELEDLFVADEPVFAPASFEALFIPDFAERVGLIAPQLAFYGLEETLLLGIHGWNSPALIRTAGQYVEGAVMVDGFFTYSSYPFVKEFVDLYFESFGEEPSILEAQAFDAAGILLSVMESQTMESREDLRLGLSQVKNFPGVTGATSFDLQGDADKILFLLQVENGNIVQIN